MTFTPGAGLRGVARDVWQDCLIFVVLAALTATLYGPYLDGPFVFDDIPFFQSDYASIFGGRFAPFWLRYWSYSTFAFQRIAFGQDPFMFRLVNVAAHLLVGGALYLFLRTLRSTVAAAGEGAPGGGDERRRPDYLAWFGVALFLLHPMSVYAVAYVVQRSILMATLFSLLMWWAHLRGLRSDRPERWYALAMVCCQLALFSKEHAVMAPVVAVLLTLLVPPRRDAKRSLVFGFAGYFTLAAAVTFTARGVIATAYEPYYDTIIRSLTHPYVASVVTQCGLFFKYLLLAWLPMTHSMSIDMREPLADISDPMSWLLPLLFAAYCLAGFMLVKRRGKAGLLGFAFLTPALLFSTELATIRVQEDFVLYRAYLWIAPMALLVPLAGSAILAARPAAGRWLPILGIAAVGACLGLAGGRLETFSSNLRVWGDAIRLSERRGDNLFRDRQYYSRGGALLMERDYSAALRDFDAALAWNPDQPIAHLGKGRALALQGRLAEGRASLDRALALKPDAADALLVRADVLYRLGNRAGALADLRRACEIAKGFACYARDRLEANASGRYSIATEH